MKEKLQKSIEEEPLIYSIEDRIGRLEVRTRQKQKLEDEIIRIKGKNSQWFLINDLLPDGYTLYFDYSGGLGGYSFYDHKNKRVVIAQIELETDKWKYLISILHEIGHAFLASQRTNEIDRLDKLQKNRQFLSYEDQKQLESLTSKTERDSWAYAIKKFREITKQINIKISDIFSNLDLFKDYINKKLNTYKAGAMGVARYFPEEIRGQVIEEFSKLYTRFD